MNSWKWHYFLCGGVGFLTVGFDAKNRGISCIDLMNLPIDELDDLLGIVYSDAGQSTPDLADVLAMRSHPNGGTWWDLLYVREFTVGLDELDGYIPPEQIEMFRARIILVNKQLALLKDGTAIHRTRQRTPEKLEEILYGGIK